MGDLVVEEQHNEYKEKTTSENEEENYEIVKENKEEKEIKNTKEKEENEGESSKENDENGEEAQNEEKEEAVGKEEEKSIKGKQTKKSPRKKKEKIETKVEKRTLRPKKRAKGEVKLYCICKKPDDGSFMVCCDTCDQWYHPECIHVSERTLKKLEKYICVDCKLVELLKRKESIESELEGLQKELTTLNQQYTFPPSNPNGNEKKRKRVSASVNSFEELGRKTRAKLENKSNDYYYDGDYIDIEKPAKHVKLSNSNTLLQSPKKRDSRQLDKAEESPQNQINKKKKSQSVPSADQEEEDRRQRIRNLFVNLFRGYACEESRAEEIAKEIEDELFRLHKSTSDYSSGARTLLSSLKIASNQSLRDRVISGSLTAQILCSMDAHDLADEELVEARKRAAEESLKSRMISSSNEPIYRKTHKGEELVSHEEITIEEKVAAAASYSPPHSPFVFSHTPLKSALMKDDDEDESDEDIFFGDDEEKESTKVKKEKEKEEKSTMEIEKSAADIEKKENDDDDELLRNATKSTIISSISNNGRIRPPKLDINQFNQIVWQGMIFKSANIQKFNIKASIVHGPEINQILKEVTGFNIIGRIDVKRLPKYFDDLDKSNTHKRTVLYLSPANSTDEFAFTAMFQYFIDKQRAAVLETKPIQHPRVREVYIVPLAADTPPPDYVIKSSNSSSSSSSSFDFLSDSKDKLICIVVYKRKSTHALKPRDLFDDPIPHSSVNISSPPHFNPSASPPFFNPVNTSSIYSPPSASPISVDSSPTVAPVNAANLTNPSLPPSIPPSSILDILNQLIKPPSSNSGPLPPHLQPPIPNLQNTNNNNSGNVNEFLNANNPINMMMMNNNLNAFLQNPPPLNNLGMGLGIPGLSPFPGLNLGNLQPTQPISQPPQTYQNHPPPINPPYPRGPVNTPNYNYNNSHNVNNPPPQYPNNIHYNNAPRSHPPLHSPHKRPYNTWHDQDKGKHRR